MRYTIVDRGDKVSISLAKKFHQLAENHHLIADKHKPDIVLSIGGDGTLLKAFHMYKEQLEHIYFVGIHTGRLGFFADWQETELDMLANLMFQYTDPAHIPIVKYPIVEIQITTDKGSESHLALNEFTLKCVEETLVARVNINDQNFEMFRGDGICISSPCGSTAYNKSVGGAIIHPSLEAIQIAEIASINNRVFRTLGSSTILPKHHHCDIYPKQGQNLLLTIDHIHTQYNDIHSIRCMVAEQKVNFARFRPFPFWNRVKEAFIDYDTK